MATRETIKDWRGRIVGYVETDNKGNKTVKDFYNRILGYYNKDLNITQDFYRRQVAKGDVAISLIKFEND